MNRARTGLLAWALCLPTLAALGIFVVFPAAQSFILSLFDYDAFMTHRTFAGLENYRLLFLSLEYWEAVGTTALFLAFTVIPSVVIALAIALMLDREPYVRGLFRTVFLMPVAISSAMAAMLWVFIFNPDSGYLNYLLERLHLGHPNWLGDPAWALIAVAITTVWKEIGFNVIFFLAGLASISRDVLDAARMDGASETRVFWHVTVPLLSPTVFFVSVVSVINAFQSFGQIHILTAGGPAGATTTLVYNLYRDAFQNFQTGSASAQAVILFALMVSATVVQFQLARRRVHYG